MGKVRIANYPMIWQMPVSLVGAWVDGRANWATVGAFGVVCTAPVLYASLKDTHHTTRGVRERGWFSVNVPASDLVAEVDWCGVVSGHDADKSKVLDWFEDEAGSAPMVRRCPLNVLCRVRDTVPVEGFTLFLADIVATFFDEERLTAGEPDVRKLDPMVLLGREYFRLAEPVGRVFREGPELQRRLERG